MIIALVAADHAAPVHELAELLCVALSRFGATLVLHAASEHIAAMAQETRFLLLVGGRDDASWCEASVRDADEVLVLASAETSLESVSYQGARARRTLLLLHREQARLPSHTARALTLFRPERHLHIKQSPEDMSRIARLLAGGSLGLCLGAGGARAAAQIGAARALRDHQIPIDHTGGTSAGAMVAAMISMRKTPEEIMEEGIRLAKQRPFEDLVLPVTSLLSGRRLEEALRELFGDARIEDLWLPFFCNACNLSTFDDDIFDSGDLVHVLMASSALPGVMPPRVIDGRLYYDGGTINPLPGVEMKRRMPGHMIAIDSSADREFFLHEESYPTSWRALWRLMRGEALMSLPTLFLRAVYSVPINHIRETKRLSTIFLQPPVERFKTSQVKSLREIEQLGFVYTTEQLRAQKSSLE